VRCRRNAIGVLARKVPIITKRREKSQKFKKHCKKMTTRLRSSDGIFNNHYYEFIAGLTVKEF